VGGQQSFSSFHTKNLHKIKQCFLSLTIRLYDLSMVCFPQPFFIVYFFIVFITKIGNTYSHHPIEMLLKIVSSLLLFRIWKKQFML